MVLGEDVENVVSKYGNLGMSNRYLHEALHECGVLYNAFVYNDLVASGWYLASVPSLNQLGTQHQIILHFDLNLGSDGLTVLDPSDKTRYLEDGSNLRSWSNLIYFVPGGSLPT